MFVELRPLCRQTVTVESRSGLDRFGEPSYGTAVSHRCRVSGKRALVLNDRGEEVVARYVVSFAAAPTIGAHDRITLSTGDAGSTETGTRQPPILAVGRYPDDRGAVTVRVFLG